MACSNCKCDKEDMPVANSIYSTAELSKKSIIEMTLYPLQDHLAAIEAFLVDKFPNELKTGFIQGTRQWLYEKNVAIEEARSLELSIRDLTQKGYHVTKTEPPSPTVENAIREVIVNNQVLSGCAVRAAIQKYPNQK